MHYYYLEIKSELRKWFNTEKNYLMAFRKITKTQNIHMTVILKIAIWILISIAGMYFIFIRASDNLFRVERSARGSKTPFENLSKLRACNPLDKNSSCVTLVTGYFAFGKSKHSLKEYEVWLHNFLGQVDTPIVIFTQPAFQPLMAEIRNGRPTLFIVYDEIWDLPWLIEPNFLYKDYHKIHDIDPENGIHSPELYAIWNSKPWMLQTASELNPFNSTYFFWMDIGCVRDSQTQLKDFPSVERAIQVFGKDETSENFHKFNMFAITTYANYKAPPDFNTFEEMARFDYVIGTFFGGTAHSINWFSGTFYNLHDEKLMEGFFVGKDQTLFNWIATQHPEKFLVVCSCLQAPWNCVDTWFYFQTWYATADSKSKCASAPVRNMTDFLLEFKNA